MVIAPQDKFPAPFPSPALASYGRSILDVSGRSSETPIVIFCITLAHLSATVKSHSTWGFIAPLPAGYGYICLALFPLR